MEGIRLRCRAHNQYEAELVFGAGFMSEKRAEARARAEARKQAKTRATEARTQAQAAKPWDDRDVTPYLRKLGYNAREARLGAEACAHIPNASLEERVRVALRIMMPPCRTIPAPSATAMAT